MLFNLLVKKEISSSKSSVKGIVQLESCYRITLS
jgi:hypothetical protein